MPDQIEYVVIGRGKMHCSGCEGRVSFALRCMPGVQTVTANSQTQRIAVTFDRALVSPAQLRVKLAEIGFEVEEVSVLGRADHERTANEKESRWQ